MPDAACGRQRSVGRARCVAVAASLVLATTSAFSATHTITIEGMQFSPSNVTVKTGDKVVWVNKDLVPHTATAPKVFDSGSIAPGKSWATTAPRPRRYEYGCTFHPTMRAVLIVE